MCALEPVSSYDYHDRHDSSSSSNDGLSAYNGSSAPSDVNKTSIFSLNGAGLRVESPWSFKGFSFFAQKGQGKTVAGLNFRVPAHTNAPGKRKEDGYVHPWADSGLDCQMSWSKAIDTRQQAGDQTGLFGSTFRRPKAVGFRTGCTLAHVTSPVKGRVGYNNETYSSSNDLGTQLDEMPIIAPSGASKPSKQIHADYMWHDYGQSNHTFDFTIMPHKLFQYQFVVDGLKKILDWLRATKVYQFVLGHWPGRSHGQSHASTAGAQNKKSWLDSIDTFGLLQMRVIGSAERYERLSQRTHEHRVYQNHICNTTWAAYLRRFINENIVCSNRYDRHGRINFWPKRLCARLLMGDLSKKELSPHNIPHMAVGERMIFAGDQNYDTRWASRLFKKSSDYEGLKTSFKNKLFRPPELAGVGKEVNYKVAYNHKTDYMTAAGGNNEPLIIAKSLATTQSGWTASAFALVIERLLHGNHSWQTIKSRTCSVESVYPQHKPLSVKNGSMPINPMLKNIPNHHLDPTGLVLEQLGVEVSEEAAAHVLHNLRDKSAGGRSDNYLQLEDLHTCPQTSTVLKSSLSPDGFGRLIETKTTLVYGTLARASFDDFNDITTEKDMFVRSLKEVVQPQGMRQNFEVLSTVKNSPSGHESIEGVKFSIDLRFPPGHEDHEVNSVLESLGTLYKEGRPFHLLPIYSEQVEVHNHPKVARDVCLTTDMNVAWLNQLRAKLQEPDTLRCAQTFGITADELMQLKESGFVGDRFDQTTLSALGLFVCKRPQPEKALQFLQKLCGGRWLKTATKSGTNRAGRISREVSDLRNTLSLPENKHQLSPQKAIAHLATIEALRQRIHCAENTTDVYTSVKARASELRVLQNARRMLERLLQARDVESAKKSLLHQGIHTTEDLLAAKSIRLHADVKKEHVRLSKEPKSSLNDLRLRELGAILLQLGRGKAAA